MDEKGEKVDQVLALLQGFQSTCVLLAGLRLGIFEHLSREPSRLDSLADRIGADTCSLARLVRVLIGLELVEDRNEGLALTALGLQLVEGESIVHPWSLLVGEEYLPTWMALEDSVRSGRPAFEEVFGTTAWERRKARPDLNRTFQQAMSQVQNAFIEPFLGGHDFSTVRRVVDVGGGNGDWLAAILGRHPGIQGVLFDLPHVVEEARPQLSHLGERCRRVGGSFLETAPPSGDLLLLKHCLHNWGDSECVTILRHCARALEPGGRLLLIESLMGEGASQRVLMRDLHMMLMFGGRERTRREYEALLQQADLGLVQITTLADGRLDVLECRGS